MSGFGQRADHALGRGIYRCEGGFGFPGDFGKFIGQGLGGVVRAGPIHQCVACHLEQPGARIVERANAAALALALDEDVLQHVVGRIAVRPPVTQIAPQLAFMRLPRRRHAGKRRAASLVGVRSLL